MRFLDELEKVLKADERFIGEDNQVIKTKVSDAARGSRVIIMTTANSNDEYWVSSPLLEKRNTDWCVFRVIMAHDYSKRTSVKEEQK